MDNNTSSARKLLSNTAFYAFADLFGKGIHFLLLPLYTAFLTTSDYGIQNMITSFNSVMNYIVLLCLDSAALKFYSEYSDDKEKLKRFYGTAMTIVVMFTLIVIVLCVGLRSLLERFVFKGIGFIPYVIMGLTILAFDAVYTLHRRMLEAQQKGKKVSSIGLITVIISSLTTLVMIGVFKLGALGVLTATLITSFGTLCFVTVDIIHNDMIQIGFDKFLAKQMLSYSLPLIPHQISGYLAALIGRIFLNTSGSLAAVGLYGIATQFSSIVDTFQDATSRAFRPWLFSLLNTKTNIDRDRINNISKILISIYSVVTVGVGIFAPEIIIIMTSKDYYNAWRVIPILVIAVSIRSIYYFYFAQCLFYKNTSRYIFVSSMTANLCNIIASAMMVPILGMFGSAIASIFSIVINTTIIYIINKKNEDIGFRLKSLILRLMVSWIVMAIGVIPSYITFSNCLSATNVGYKTIVIIIYILLVWIMNRKAIFEVTETSKVKDLLCKLKRKKT